MDAIEDGGALSWRAVLVRLLAAGVALLAAHRVLGEEPVSRDEPEMIVVTGTRTARSIETTTIPTEVIDREQILRTSVRGIEDVLNQIPGIFVRNNEQFRLGASTIRMQGADANKVAILLNGRRFRGGVDGIVDLRDIPVGNVERIEVIRGPASSLYGSDAMGGVVNIVTRQGYDEPTLDLTAGGGTFESVLLEAAHGYQIGDLSYFVSARHAESEIAQELGAISSQFDGESADAKQSRTNASLQLDQRLGEAHRVSFIGEASPVREGPASDRLDLNLAGDWQWAFSEVSNVRVGATRYGFDRQNELPGFQEDVGYVDWTFDTVATGTFAGPFDTQHILSAGYVHRRQELDSEGVLREFGDGSSFLPPDIREDVYWNSAFLQDEIELTESISAVVGTSFDVHSLFDPVVNPRLALAWRPAAATRLAVLFGRGYRAPDLLQLFDSDFNNVIGVDPNGVPQGYAIIGNPDLQPETDRAWNLQADFAPHEMVSGFLTLFRHDFDDLIATSLCDEDCRAAAGGVLPSLVFTNENIDKAITQGVELSLTLKPLAPFDVVEHDLTIDLGYAFLDSEDRSGRENDGNELPFRPPHRFLPGATYDHLRWGTTFRLWGEWEDRTYADVTNTAVVASHWVWNFKLDVRPMTLLGHTYPESLRALDGIAVFAEGHNLFDVTFGIPGPMGRAVSRRTFLFGLTYRM